MLGLADGADADQARRAFRALAKDAHPDVGGDPAAFHRLRTALDVLVGTGAGGPTVDRPIGADGGGSTRSDAARAAGERAARTGRVVAAVARPLGLGALLLLVGALTAAAGGPLAAVGRVLQLVGAVLVVLAAVVGTVGGVRARR